MELALPPPLHVVSCRSAVHHNALVWGDADGDGESELVAGGTDGSLVVYKRGRALWACADGLFECVVCARVGDVLRRGRPSVLAVGARGVCRVFDITLASRGEQILCVAELGSSVCSVLLAALPACGDGLSLVVGGFDRRVAVWRASDRAAERSGSARYSLAKVATRRVPGQVRSLTALSSHGGGVVVGLFSSRVVRLDFSAVGANSGVGGSRGSGGRGGGVGQGCSSVSEGIAMESWAVPPSNAASDGSSSGSSTLHFGQAESGPAAAAAAAAAAARREGGIASGLKGRLNVAAPSTSAAAAVLLESASTAPLLPPAAMEPLVGSGTEVCALGLEYGSSSSSSSSEMTGALPLPLLLVAKHDGYVAAYGGRREERRRGGDSGATAPDADAEAGARAGQGGGGSSRSEGRGRSSSRDRGRRTPRWSRELGGSVFRLCALSSVCAHGSVKEASAGGAATAPAVAVAAAAAATAAEIGVACGANGDVFFIDARSGALCYYHFPRPVLGFAFNSSVSLRCSSEESGAAASGEMAVATVDGDICVFADVRRRVVAAFAPPDVAALSAHALARARAAVDVLRAAGEERAVSDGGEEHGVGAAAGAAATTLRPLSDRQLIALCLRHGGALQSV